MKNNYDVRLTKSVAQYEREAAERRLLQEASFSFEEQWSSELFTVSSVEAEYQVVTCPAEVLQTPQVQPEMVSNNAESPVALNDTRSLQFTKEVYDDSSQRRRARQLKNQLFVAVATGLLAGTTVGIPSAIGSPPASAEIRPTHRWIVAFSEKRPAHKTDANHPNSIESQDSKNFEMLHQRLDLLSQLKDDWDEDGAKAPNDWAIQRAHAALVCMKEIGLRPFAVLASVENGVGITFESENRYADIEFFNTEKIAAVTDDYESVPKAWDIDSVDQSALNDALSRIKTFIYG